MIASRTHAKGLGHELARFTTFTEEIQMKK